MLKSRFHFSDRSYNNLKTCDLRLIVLMSYALVTSDIDFTVICGHRNKEDQNKAFDEGYSRVRFPNGKHNSLPSLAVDIIPYVPGEKDIWSRIDLFRKLGKHIKKCSKELGIEIVWGGQWKHFKDYGHYELAE